jgi:hypothetical protein
VKLHRQFDPCPIAERIWEEVGYRLAFPRDLLQPLMETFEVAVIFVPQLSIVSVNRWLSEKKREPIRGHKERPLRACLLARRGHAFIFLDGSAAPEERNFALAHEWAHYFAHYLQPRRRAIAQFGQEILPVLDGVRPATTVEKLSGIIREVPIGPFIDLLGRNQAGEPNGSILDTETEADLIAFELLAPRAEASRLAASGSQVLSAALQTRFGLPMWASVEWARFVLDLQPRSDPILLSLERATKKNT